MLLILWSVCWLVCCASLTADLATRRRRQDLRQTRYIRLAEISLMVVATGGILNYLLNDQHVPGDLHLRMAAHALQLVGYVGAVSSALGRLAIGRTSRSRAGVPPRASEPS